MSNGDKIRVTVDIYGMEYKLMGASSAGYTKRVAEYVNEQMHQTAKLFPRLDTPRLAVLASVNMADEYFKMRTQIDEVQQQLQNAKELGERYTVLEENLRLIQESSEQEAARFREREQELSDEVERSREQAGRTERELEAERLGRAASAEQHARELGKLQESADELLEANLLLEESVKSQELKGSALENDLLRLNETNRKLESANLQLEETYGQLRESYSQLEITNSQQVESFELKQKQMAEQMAEQEEQLLQELVTQQETYKKTIEEQRGKAKQAIEEERRKAEQAVKEERRKAEQLLNDERQKAQQTLAAARSQSEEALKAALEAEREKAEQALSAARSEG
ncbi:hypothetical protein FE784_17705, partial [Paenibacillus hemerocallicola]